MMLQTPVRVAYADDHLAVRKGIISLLDLMGNIKVDIEADNGSDLLSQLQTATRLPDVCLLDINMPVMNGFDTLVAIKKKWPQMKVLVLTVFESDHYIIRMIKNGANGYLLKDCSPHELHAALFAVAQEGVYYSRLVSPRFSNAIKQNLVNLPNFTAKETMVMKYCCSDLTYAEIAEKMKTTTRSVEGYRDSLFKKLQLNSRVSLALYAVQTGIVPIEISTYGL
jgi:DNA-binding NarL/FixJ family response regulator